MGGLRVAIGHGKLAARHIDAWLHDHKYRPAPDDTLAGLDELSTCPGNAVIKLDPTRSHAYEIDHDYCKGWGLCAQECPCGPIETEREQI